MDEEKIKYVSCKARKIDKESLKNYSQEELIEKILALQSHNEQLKNIISKNMESNISKKEKNKKEFDFSKCTTQHILLKILYFGWDYQGYASQEDTIMTIEHHLMSALLKCKLIRSRESSNYHRCGRTDKGVSAFDQVISITVRSSGEGKPPLEYCKMLNRLLPEDIRAVAWQPVPQETSARFNCKSRTYKYFFPRADFDLEAMNVGASYLIGTFDFRNLCKMDVGNGVTNFTRTIYKASVSNLPEHGFPGTGYEMCSLTIQSQAFLWHQIRCIMAVLFLIGKGHEEPTVIKELLDIEKNPRKPQYPLASDIGLNLFNTEFELGNWMYDEEEIKHVIQTIQKQWAANAIKACHLKSNLDELEKFVRGPVLKQDTLLLRTDSKIYKPLFTRNLCGSLEERIDHYTKRRRIQKEEKE